MTMCVSQAQYQITGKVCEICGIDPEETNGHVDAVACFVRPGEVACIYTEDPACPFYGTAQKCYQQLCGMTDAKGRRLKVHKVCCSAEPVRIEKDFYRT